MKMLLAAVLAAMMLFSFAACGGGGGKEEGTIKVGILGPHTGDLAVYGLAVRYGAEMYFNKVNEAGGVNGKKVEVVVYDDQGDSTMAVTGFTSLVDSGIVALVGEVTTGNCRAVVDEAYPINMPMVTASATATSITYDEDTKTVFSNVFRTCFIDAYQGSKMADFAFSRKIAGICMSLDFDRQVRRERKPDQKFLVLGSEKVLIGIGLNLFGL